MMLKIDAHHHCWAYEPVKHGWIDNSMQVIQRDFYPDDLKPALIENGVAGTILVQADQSPEENIFMVSLAHKYPEIRGIVGWIDLLAHDLDEQLAEWNEQPLMKGFRHVAQAEPDGFLARPDIINGIAAFEKFGFTYDILVKPPQLEAAISLVEALPNQAFVVDHIAKPYIAAKSIEPWRKHINQLASNENVCCKLSGMVTEADWMHWTFEDLRPYIDVVFEAFGSTRIMFGSDWPVCLVAASYNKVLHTATQYMAAFSDTEQEAFWYNNAHRFYKLT
jgi:L-fuconolactonase